MPDAREFFRDPEEAFRAAWAGVRSHMHTALPVIVAEDSDGHTVSLQIAIKQQISDATYDETIYQPFPLLTEVPVKFASGGGCTFTHPVKKGDEGVVIFSSRAIDAWHQSGGVQQPIFNRFHSIADGVAFLPGIRSTPRKLDPAPSTTSAQLRSDDGKHVVDLHPKNGITHTSTVAVAIDAPAITYKGDVTIQPRDDGTGGNLHVKQVNGQGGNVTADQTVGARTVTAPEGSVGT